MNTKKVPLVVCKFINVRLFKLCHLYIEHLCLAAFLTQTIHLNDVAVKFEIWDTAGQERYHSLAPMYYRGAQAAIVVYDITNQVIIYLFIASNCNEHESINEYVFKRIPSKGLKIG